MTGPPARCLALLLCLTACRGEPSRPAATTEGPNTATAEPAAATEERAGAPGAPASAIGGPEYVYRIPEETGDGWPVGSAADAGMRMDRLAELVAAITGGELPNLHAVLIVLDGRLVFDEYFTGSDERRGQSLGVVDFRRETLHDLRSVTKSVTSALVGVAVHRGMLNLSTPVASFLGHPTETGAEGKGSITVEHLLTMTSGLELDEATHPYTDPRNSETAMDLSDSSVEYVLGRPLVASPGARFRYCGGCTMLLAALIREATAHDLDVWAEEVLFGPLGITEYEWLRHRDGLPVAASGLRLRPRDLAKFGYLYANEGRWKGREVIPAAWVEESTRLELELDSISGYGYQWWADLESVVGETAPLPVARGNGGQRVYVVPSLDLVAVVTAGNYNSADSRYSEIAFWRYTLPAAGAGGTDPP